MPTISGWSTGEPVASADINAYLMRGNRNAIINGDMRINQRGLTSISDDAFCVDRWNILSDGATITIAQSSVAPSDGKYSLSMVSGTANKKFGVAQYIENLNCVGMFGQMVTLSFKAKVSNATNLANIKAGILSWSSTVDSLTSDFVSSWGASGTTPTLVSNWTLENTPSNLGVTTSWTTYRVQGVIDTVNAANVAVFIWSDGTANTTSDTLYVTDVQLEIGAIASPFERRTMADELVRCQRYYEKSYALATVPGTNSVAGLVQVSGSTDSANNQVINFQFKVAKRTTSYTISVWTYDGTANNWRYQRNGATGNSVPAVDLFSENGFRLYTNNGAAWVVATIDGHYACNAEL